MGFRVGDNAPMAYVELTEKPAVKPAEEKAPAKVEEAKAEDVKAEEAPKS